MTALPIPPACIRGLSRGDLRDVVDQLHTLMIGREPDLTILIDMDPAIGLALSEIARNRGRTV